MFELLRRLAAVISERLPAFLASVLAEVLRQQRAEA